MKTDSKIIIRKGKLSMIRYNVKIEMKCDQDDYSNRNKADGGEKSIGNAERVNNGKTTSSMKLNTNPGKVTA